MNAIFKGIGFLAIFSLMALPVQAERTRGGDRHREGRLERMAAELALTAEQQEKMKTIHEKYEGAHSAMKEKIHAAHQSLDEALRTDASEDVLRQKFSAIEDLKAEAGKQRFEKVLEVRKVLTAEQRLKFHEIMQKRHRRHRGEGPRERGEGRPRQGS